MPPIDDKRTLVATRLGEIRPEGLSGSDLTYQGRQIGDGRKDLPNVWVDVNTFFGMRLVTKNLTSGVDGISYDVSPLDCELSIDASFSDFTFNLPFALGIGQQFGFKRTDDSSNVVTIAPRPGELIDGDSASFLEAQYDYLPVSDRLEGVWSKRGSISGGGVIPGDVARLSTFNLFTNINTFTGIRLSTKTIRSSIVSIYQATAFDYEILAVCDAGPLTILLPFATGSGQPLRIKKKDPSDEIVHIIAQDGDVIDDSISVNMGDQFADCQLFDGETGYWDNNGIANALIIPDDPPATPTDMREVVALLQSYGLCA